MTLAQYMKHHSLTPEAMADLIGEVSAHGVRKWRSGERTPRPDQMRRIHAATAGQVTPNDFFLPVEAVA